MPDGPNPGSDRHLRQLAAQDRLELRSLRGRQRALGNDVKGQPQREHEKIRRLAISLEV